MKNFSKEDETILEAMLLEMSYSGGVIVCSSEVDAEVIAEAREVNHVAVDNDGIGYVYLSSNDLDRL